MVSATRCCIVRDSVQGAGTLKRFRAEMIVG
jgi:hypothetical protein